MDYVYYIVQILINYCITDRKIAEYEIREFAAQVEFGEYNNGESFICIVPEHASAILNLGMVVLERIDQLGMYDGNWELPYHYDPTAFVKTSEIILQITPEEDRA